ncbi:hypothetical protein E4U55_004917 [Claviceps digitariae]|nr:hypothetical protein E4U55_004917 [Claviceps digitariae]
MASTKLSSLFGLVALSLAQDCYWPAGGQASNLLACGTTAADSTNSACCYKNHYCLSNGLCFEPASMTMYRAGCTDRNFKSPSCASYCYGTSPNLGISEGDSHSGVWTCGGSKYACDPSLCSTKNFTIPAAKLVTNAALRADVANLTSTATIAATATATTCSATQAPSEKQCSASEGISTAGAVGIGVGVGAPLAMATAALLILLLREKRKAKPPNKPELEATHQHHPAQGMSSLSNDAPVNSNGYYGRDDVNGKDAPSSEIMGTPRHEMGS